MPTLFDKTDRDAILARISNLSASSQRQWGKMSVSQMLKHMSTAFAVPTGKIQLPKDKLYYVAANPFTRWVMIQVMTKWPKNMATVDAFIVKDDPAFETAKKDFMENFNAFILAPAFPGSHPAFGVMSKELWGQAMYIHLDHHLKQFGV
ncbi:MAG: DUF1569 domain-containing protein [Chitinophagales bacterium]